MMVKLGAGFLTVIVVFEDAAEAERALISEDSLLDAFDKDEDDDEWLWLLDFCFFEDESSEFDEDDDLFFRGILKFSRCEEKWDLCDFESLSACFDSFFSLESA